MDYVNGQFTARTPEEFQQLLQMAASGGPTSGGNVGLGMDSPVLAAASTFLPGAQPSVDVAPAGSGAYMTSPDVSTTGAVSYTHLTLPTTD